MAIKKFRVLKNQLPPVNSDNEYSIRFRIISEDKNRVSHWSPIFLVESLTPQSVSGGLEIGTNTITAVWGDEEGRPYYDVFVKFDNGSYSYHGTTAVHSYSFLKTGTVNVRVAIQIEGSSKTRNAGLTIWESSLTSL